METIRLAAMEMTDVDALNDVLAGLEDSLESVVHYANGAIPGVREIIGK